MGCALKREYLERIFGKFTAFYLIAVNPSFISLCVEKDQELGPPA